MDKRKEVVLLTGASGSMGFQAFRMLWEKRDRYDIVLLLRPSRANKKRFRNYERMAGIVPTAGPGTVKGNGLKIVWGDALNREDVTGACQGIDWCLHLMAVIPPEADRDPAMTVRVNRMATGYVIEAIEEQDPERIRMVYVGSLAAYGSRLPPLHVGRLGDPVQTCAFDYYTPTKIGAELAVMESRIRNWVTLRQTFIMIPDIFSLLDPIMFHQPLGTYMENITARDAGRVLVSCLDMKDEKGFWRKCYNVSGGPGCRITYLELLERLYRMTGMDYRKVMERRWFALGNFHMFFFEDTHVLNGYLHHWEGGETMEDYFRQVWDAFPLYLKLVSWLNRHVRPIRLLVQWITHGKLRRLALRETGPLGWIRNGDEERIRAFYGSVEAFRNIPGWDEDMPCTDHNLEYVRLDHGYDESAERLEREDLERAAAFRGGKLVSPEWDGDMYTPLTWSCYLGNTFTMTPYAVLKGGHWCPECVHATGRYAEIARKNPFAAQVLDGCVPCK
jgi:nucleoside-diphosphate-sugar epimerase